MRFFTQRGWVEAKNLSESDEVQIIQEQCSYLQEQMIFGTLLGDASLSRGKTGNPRYTVSHSIKFSDYNDVIENILGTLFSNRDSYFGGFENSGKVERIVSRNSPVFNDFYNNFYGKEGKFVDYLFLKKHLSPISLAFWYMDDGSCNFSLAQEPRPVFHTQCFSMQDCLNIVSVFREKFDIEANVNMTKKGPIVAISSFSSEKFFTLISPYILKCMEYKMPKNFISTFNNDLYNFCEKYDKFGPSTIKVKEVKKSNYECSQYDIETEEHNYLVSSNGVLVHNSQFSMAVLDGELTCRSKGANLIIDAPQKMFSKGIETAVSLKDKLHPGWVYRGEYLCLSGDTKIKKIFWWQKF